MPFRGRVAYPSYVDESLFGHPHEAAASRLRTNAAAERKQVSLLSSQELGHIATRASRQQATDERQAEKKRLHELSNSRKAKWPNTLEAARASKERAREEKLEAEEAMRVEIDREEEALAAEKRRLAIEQANKMLYDNTDRVKALHSKMMLTDVLQEREQQLKMKSLRQAREVATEEKWYNTQQEAIRKMDAEEDAREAEDRAKKAEVARIRAQQIGLQRERQEAKNREHAAEADMMRSALASDMEAERRRRNEDAANAAQMRAEFVEANRYLQQQKEEEAQILSAEEERMYQYALRKEHDLLERRTREEDRFNARQTWRQQLIDKQIAKLTDLNVANNARLEAQAVEVQKKAMDARAKVDEKRKDDLLIAHMSRQQQMRWKAERKAQEEADAKHYASAQQALNAQLREEEAQNIRATFERNKANDSFLFKQMAQKRDLMEDEKQEDLLQAEMSAQWQGDDDAIFGQYAQLCLDEYVAAGKNPRPIQLQLEKSARGPKITAGM